jgi:CBS-domain-containing membrane protein
MKQVADVMTDDVFAVEPQETLRRAAELMAKLDVGSLPVCSDLRVLGIVTDRPRTWARPSAPSAKTKMSTDDPCWSPSSRCHTPQ